MRTKQVFGYANYLVIDLKVSILSNEVQSVSEDFSPEAKSSPILTNQRAENDMCHNDHCGCIQCELCTKCLSCIHKRKEYRENLRNG